MKILRIMKQTDRICGYCGQPFRGALRARWCSNACKQAAYRERKERIAEYHREHVTTKP